MSSQQTDSHQSGSSHASASQDPKFSSPLPDFPQGNNTAAPNLGPGPVPQGFFQIIDVSVEWQRGNFLPALHCLRYNLLPKDFYDQTGYNVLHHAVSQGSIPIVLALLDYFKFDVNIRSKNNQTPLMIACNYGNIEIIRLLIERGAQVNESDDTRFSPLLYSAKQGFFPQLVYLLHHRADPTVRDANGCSMVHWAAYKNNAFLLAVFKRLGFDLNGTDATGLTPLDRALQSDGYVATKYLLENGDGKMPPNMKFDQVQNPDLKELLRKQYFPTKYEQLVKQYVDIFKQHSQKITFGIYAFFWFWMMTIYLHAAMNNGLGYTFDLMFFLFNIYSIAYSFWYFLKSAHLKSKVFGYKMLDKSSENLDDTISSINDTARGSSVPRLNSDALDRLVKGDSHGTVIHDIETDEPTSFLHELAWNFEVKNYKAIAKFNENDYCPKCLQKKPERSYHPEGSRTCVPYFHHYSYTLGRSIDRNNHYLYLFLLISQAVTFGMFFASLWGAYSGSLNQRVFALLEIGFRLYQDFSLFYGLIYTILLVLSGYNFVFLCIELYGVARNITYHELFNMNKCPYLFAMKQDRRGQIVKYFFNKDDISIGYNIKQYLKRIIH